MIVEALKMKQATENHENLIKKAHEMTINDWEKCKTDHHRLAFHLDPPSNWMNDPNGLVYFKGEYHVFYQLNPFEAQNGLKYWGHFRSPDFIQWELLPPAIAPGDDYDLDGCWSGSAVDDDGRLTLIYTGHVDDKSPKEVQCLATSEDGVHFTKCQNNPVIASPPSGFSEDFRDPKVWKHHNNWYMVVGNGKDGHGQVLLYQSMNLVDWQFKGIMAESNGTQGFMWECPDLIQLQDEHVLLLSPEGMDGIKHKSIYITGEMNYETSKFTQHEYQLIDYGSDFYAPQTLKDASGRTIMVGWMNLWESSMPTQAKGWVGSLTIPRELSLNDEKKLIQKPVEELKQLRQKEHAVTVNDFTGEMTLEQELEFGEIQLDVHFSNQSTQFGLKLRCSEDGKEETILGIDTEKQVLFIDRAISGEGDGTRIEAPITLKDQACSLQIFLDRSSLEVFANDGETVVTTRIYPKQNSQSIKVYSNQSLQTTLNLWELHDRMIDLKIVK